MIEKEEMRIPLKAWLLAVTWPLGLIPVGMLLIDTRWPLSLQIFIGLLLLGLGILASRAHFKSRKWAWVCSLIFGWSLAVVFVAPIVVMFILGIFRMSGFMNVSLYLLSVGVTYWMILSPETRQWFKNNRE